MASKGSNAILFEVDSVIDKEISVLNFIKHEYSDYYKDTSLFDMIEILSSTLESFKYFRINGISNLFYSLTKDVDYALSRNLLNNIYEQYEEEILDKYMVTTDMVSLIRAYGKAGNGIVKSAIRCDTNKQQAVLQEMFPNANIIVAPRTSIDTDDYGRFIFGDCKNLFDYDFDKPKSILIMNFRENFSEDDITLLNPELVIRFGDIHSIEVISAYNNF